MAYNPKDLVNTICTDADCMASLCIPCPTGFDCTKRGANFSTVSILEGYWRSSAITLNVYLCLRASQCPGGSAAAAANSGNGTSTAGSLCQANHHGPLCAICDTGYYSTATGDCAVCPSTGGAWISFILLVTLVILLLLVQFWILLRSSSELLKEAKRQDDRKREGVDEFEEYMASDASGAQKINMSLHVAPPPPPSLIYKMKIALGFIQIMTNMAFSVDIPWPSGYKEFISGFNVFNFDFVKISSVECIFSTNYYNKFLIISITPLALFLAVAVFYLLPKVLGACYRDDSEDARKRSRRRFWRMFLFVTFLIYPTVSSVVIRLYVCKKIEGIDYLLGDLSIECSGSKYESYKQLGIFMILLYPVGIPILLFYMLFKYRNKLHEEAIKAEMGFLYDGYDHKLWFFELVDMFHKLFLVAVLAFFPNDLQLPFALAVVTSYSCLILFTNPYIRKGDDRLHLLCQTEIYLLLLSVYVFQKDLTVDSVLDGILSAVLIVMVLVFFAFFVPQVVLILLKMCVLHCPCCAKRLRRFSRVKGWLGEKQPKQNMLSSDVVQEVHSAATGGAETNIATGGPARKRRESDDGVRLQRNPLHDGTVDNAVANLHLDEMNLVANPLIEQYHPQQKETAEALELMNIPVTQTVEVPVEDIRTPQPVPQSRPSDAQEMVAKNKFKEEFAPKRPKQKAIKEDDQEEGPGDQ